MYGKIIVRLLFRKIFMKVFSKLTVIFTGLVVFRLMRPFYPGCLLLLAVF